MLPNLTLFYFTAKYDVKVSVNDIVIKAVAIALRNVPEANGKRFPIFLTTLHDYSVLMIID